jgi:hypothetical protein
VSEDHPIPTCYVVLSPPAEDKWHREYRAFSRMLPELMQTHLGKYVAVHEERVVGSGEDNIAVALQAYRDYGYVPIHVGLVSSDPRRIERIPTRRLPRNLKARIQLEELPPEDRT